jgi:hypothetical protein
MNEGILGFASLLKEADLNRMNSNNLATAHRGNSDRLLSLIIEKTLFDLSKKSNPGSMEIDLKNLISMMIK